MTYPPLPGHYFDDIFHCYSGPYARTAVSRRLGRLTASGVRRTPTARVIRKRGHDPDDARVAGRTYMVID